jgi:hypothetical protein
MRHFVHRENIKHLEAAISHATEPGERRRLEGLLDEEKAKFQEAENQSLGEIFSDPNDARVSCDRCMHLMPIHRIQDMDVRGKGRFGAVLLVCDTCQGIRIVIGDKPIALDKAGE